MSPAQRARLEAVAGKASTADKTYWLPGDDDLFPAITAALAHIDALEARVTPPHDCSICRQPDCTTEHACE